MRIAFDAKRAFNNFTGLGNYSRLIVASLQRYYPQNEYFLFTPKVNDLILDDFIENAQVVLPKKSLHQLFAAYWRSWGLATQLIQNRVDVFHGLSNELPFNANSFDCKKVVTIHDLLFQKHPDDFPLFDRLFYAIKTNDAVKKADLIAVNSNATQKDLVDVLNVSEKKIIVIPNAVGDHFFSKKTETERQSILQKYELPQNFILQTGSFLKRKNHLRSIDAFQQVLKHYDDLFLVFTGGGGSFEKQVLNRIEQLNLSSRILVRKKVDASDLPAIYQSAKVVLYPSQNEGFGLPILEAFASEVPVVTNCKAVFRETGGDAAFYVDAESVNDITNAILKLFENREFRTHLIQKGNLQVANFTSERLAKRTMELYEKL